ncbi:NAD(P)/FAD-dependent oxidoreductase [Trinickia diaoshuihuensis]|uniref:NAD(P)/FAD-dependent oxidoreductase n=1 Tax=Trinickia diaoshuihuensis TaxID=2292265 RepID=UPI000E26CD2F|nr:FAD-dependent monooxygenase [Trinickia diaoshuihuensis]
MERFDVIVVGASVSGAPTAMLLARRGYKVLLIDRKHFPRDTLSTHFIWPRGVSYLKRWGIADSILSETPHFTRMEVSVEGISIVGSIPLPAIEQRFLELHGDSVGATNTYCGPRRLLLDHILVKAAATAGADIREGVTFTRPITENSKIIGIQAVTEQGAQLQATAPVVIGADGRFSQFAKAVRAETIDYRETSTFAYFGYFSGIDKQGLTIRNRGRLGTAIFPTSDGTHMVLAYGPSAWWDHFRRDPEASFLRTYDFCDADSAERIRTSKREEPFKACGSMPAFQRANIGDSWALIGDAGSFKDQVTAMGITHAFRDAELISFHIDRALRGEIPLGEALRTYRTVRSGDYEAYFNFVCRVAELNVRPREELAAILDVSRNQQRADEFLAQFGDTLHIPMPAISPHLSEHPTVATAGCTKDAVPGYDCPPYSN